MNKENIILEFMKDENYTPMKAKEIAETITEVITTSESTETETTDTSEENT